MLKIQEENGPAHYFRTEANAKLYVKWLEDHHHVKVEIEKAEEKAGLY